MRKRLIRRAPAICALLTLLLMGTFLTPWGLRAQTTVLNYFSPAVGRDNAVHFTGSVSIGTSVVLTNAQILAIHNTPVTLVAAPGAGKYIDVIGVTVATHYVATYSNGGNLRLFWGSHSAGNGASGVITASGLLTSISADALLKVAGVPDGEIPPTTNLPLVLEEINAVAFTAGDVGNTVTVNVEYRVVTTGL